ncbi:MAG: ABC transporter ATP-binding protein [Rhodospirillaceae bacterium]|nr:ABC transporter ATP-binding protein [Rhodospirillaceae bacterium]
MADLVLDTVTKRFGPTTALDAVSIAVRSGEFVSLVGASGCGKTTLLRIVAGFTRADRGTVSVAGVRVDTLPPHRREIGFVFQSYALFPTKTVAQNIAFGLHLKRAPKREIAARVAELAALVRLDDITGRYPHQLSGGQQQRVALARALAPGPKLLLLDEPLSALDARIRAHLRTEIRRIVEQTGVTAVYVTHDQEEALSISDRVAVMDRGRIVQEDDPVSLYRKPQSRFVAEFLGESNILPARSDGNGALIVDGLGARLPRPAGLPVAEVYAVSVRPESVVLGNGGAGALAQGRLVSADFLGAAVRLRVAVDGIAELTALCPSVHWAKSGVGAGGPVSVHVAPEDMAVFPDTGAAGA